MIIDTFDDDRMRLMPAAVRERALALVVIEASRFAAIGLQGHQPMFLYDLPRVLYLR